MESEILLSLCIPTNGVVEWVKIVLDSIYMEGDSVGNFEVIVTDNGSNDEFERMMVDYQSRFDNLIYKKTSAQMFLNQIEAFKLANGKLIKFINHRMKLLPGALSYLLDYVKKNEKTEPVTYFLNGVMTLPNENNVCSDFDSFVGTLSYWSSWSAGTAIWKSDFETMDIEKPFNRLFPHIDLVFNNRTANEYIVNNKIILEEIPSDVTKKGNYDLFDAFAVEYVKVIEELYKSGFIKKETYEFVKCENRNFVVNLYYDYVVRRYPCSYDLSGYKKAINVYYKDFSIKKDAYLRYIRFLFSAVYRRIFKRGL